MRVKAIDVARKLGISKSTVSLVLNDKPGVNEQTRKKVLACKAAMERGDVWKESEEEERYSEPTGQEIKVLKISRGLRNVQGAEMDLWTDVNAVFERCIREKGYSLGILYHDLLRDSEKSMIQQCNQEKVAGVIVLGTEMYPEDKTLLNSIHKPLVIYDADIGTERYPEVMVNNRQGIEQAVDRFWKAGVRDLHYFGNTMYMYNYVSRQRGFLEALEKRGISDAKSRIRFVGSSIEESYQSVKHMLEEGFSPCEGLIMDCYQVSIGCLRALVEAHISIPDHMHLIGVDVLPPYLTSGYRMTSIRIPHTERAYWVVQLLFHEMNAPSSVKSKLYMDCELLEGETV